MSAIEAGDLVICVHVHCEQAASCLGSIRQVRSIQLTEVGRCVYCGGLVLGLGQTIWSLEGGKVKAYPLTWVRKIEPLSEAETITRWDEVSA